MTYDDCGVPLASGKRLLLPTEDHVLALDEATGKETARATIPEKCSVAYSGALFDASLLQPTENGVCILDTNSMTIKTSRSLGGETASDCAVKDGLGYVAIKVDGGYEFLCIDLGSDTLDTVWSVSSALQPTAPALLGEYVVWGCGDKLMTHHYKDDSASEIPLGKDIASAPFTTEYAVFFSTTDGNAGKLRLNSDGTLEDDTLTYCETGASPATPLSWNGRLYVPTADGLYILDNLNMEVSYIIPEIKGGCTPQVHYGSGPYIYTVAPREDRWAVYCVRDMDENSEPVVAILAQMHNYEGGTFCASAMGTLYFRDGIGRVYALTIVPFNLFSLILRLVVLLALLALVFFWLKKVAKRRVDIRPKY